ncbi:MAG: TOBE domain-containing protein [Leptolyngbyaceae cyanobacterium SM2_5_2]|nr:TOBE domain-containing protein [Leptolyngbyaceae cyanobacterium SM2_5_2]
MPRKDQGWITFQASAEEREILEAYCQQTHRSKTEVLRELVRNLPSLQALSSAHKIANSALPEDIPEHPSVLGPFQVSARNLLRGCISKLYQDGVNTEVTLSIAPNIEITSVITTSSAQRLGLRAGKVVYAMVKSSNVMIVVNGSLDVWEQN